MQRFHYERISLSEDVDGARYGLRLRPFPYVEIEWGSVDDSVTDRRFFANVRLSIDLGRTTHDRRGLKFSGKPFELGSIRELRLDKVRREDNIRVERTSTGGSAAITISRGT